MILAKLLLAAHFQFQPLNLKVADSSIFNFAIAETACIARLLDLHVSIILYVTKLNVLGYLHLISIRCIILWELLLGFFIIVSVGAACVYQKSWFATELGCSMLLVRLANITAAGKAERVGVEIAFITLVSRVVIVIEV